MKNQPLTPFSHLRIYREIRKQPKLLKEIFSILGHYSNEFLKERSIKYLYKLTKVRSSFLEKSPHIKAPEQRDFFMKFLAVKFQNESDSRKVLGVAFSFHLLSGYEKFDDENLDQILRKLVPGAYILDESVCFSYLKKQQVLFCYFEIEKVRGKELNFQECFKLKKLLPQKIKEEIEFLAPRLFTPKNEEDGFRTYISRL